MLKKRKKGVQRVKSSLARQYSSSFLIICGPSLTFLFLRPTNKKGNEEALANVLLFYYDASMGFFFSFNINPQINNEKK